MRVLAVLPSGKPPWRNHAIPNRRDGLHPFTARLGLAVAFVHLLDEGLKSRITMQGLEV